jgi:hypothetical protein
MKRTSIFLPKWKPTSILRKVEDDFNFKENFRWIFLNFFFELEEDLNIFANIEDDLNFKENGRQSIFMVNVRCHAFLFLWKWKTIQIVWQNGKWKMTIDHSWQFCPLVPQASHNKAKKQDNKKIITWYCIKLRMCHQLITSSEKGSMFACDQCLELRHCLKYITIIYTRTWNIYTCHICGHQTSSKRRLKNHQQVAHEGKNYPCRECEYQATKKGSLTQHQAAVHAGKMYLADSCDYQATSRGHLTIYS